VPSRGPAAAGSRGEPRTAWATRESLALDAAGYLLSGPDLPRPLSDLGWALPRDPYLLETSRAGVFVAGDVRHGSTKRVATAVGEGAMAVQLVHRHLLAA
jgi:thioredoxin reductase (NADPH)